MRDESREVRQDPGHRFFEFQLQTKSDKKEFLDFRKKGNLTLFQVENR